MSKKKQTLIYSSLSIASVLLALMILEVGLAKTVSPSPGGEPPAEEGQPETPMLPPQAYYPAFTLTTSRTITRNGRERLLSTQQRFQRSDEVYKLVQTFYAADGTVSRVQTYFGFIGLGVFRLDQARQRLVFTGPQIDHRPADVREFLRTHELFTREESVAGVNTVVWRHAGETEENKEEYRAASLGGLLIKSVKVSAEGRETVEPTNLEMGEPAQSLFTELLSYPADYSFYERSVQETARDAPEVAGWMRELLDRMRQVRPGSASGQ